MLAFFLKVAHLDFFPSVHKKIYLEETGSHCIIWVFLNIQDVLVGSNQED